MRKKEKSRIMFEFLVRGVKRSAKVGIYTKQYENKDEEATD